MKLLCSHVHRLTRLASPHQANRSPLVFCFLVKVSLTVFDLVKKAISRCADFDRQDRVCNHEIPWIDFAFSFTCSDKKTAHRKHKKLAPVCHAIVCNDCTLLSHAEHTSEPVYCIELKPKQGFLSYGHERCPFCLNQFLKVPYVFFFLIPFFMWSRQCGCLTACYWSLFLTCECVDDTKAWTWKWMTLSLRLFFYCETSRNSLLLINGRGNTAKSTYWASIARWISFRVHGLVWSKLSWHWRGLRKIIFEYFK